jgi:hypothetical protein
MRSVRMALLLDYCKELTAQICYDQMKVELLGETRQMRARAFLLPRESMVHKLMPADYGELFWSAFSDEKKGPNGKPDMFWDSDARQMS